MKTSNEIILSLNDLISKLGYLDLREFLALNRLALDKSEHKSIVHRIKGTFLSFVLQRSQENQRKVISNFFNEIEILHGRGTEAAESKKLEAAIDMSPDHKKLFFQMYHAIKQKNHEKEIDSFDSFQRIKYANQIKNKLNSSYLDRILETEIDNEDSYTDVLIKRYRKQRTSMMDGKVEESFQYARDAYLQKQKQEEVVKVRNIVSEMTLDEVKKCDDLTDSWHEANKKKLEEDEKKFDKNSYMSALFYSN